MSINMMLMELKKLRDEYWFQYRNSSDYYEAQELNVMINELTEIIERLKEFED